MLPVVLFAAIVLLRAPAVLAFPHETTIGRTRILSDRPIGPGIHAVIDRADRLLRASPLHDPAMSRQVVLTDGGWRWRVLAAGYGNAVALRRPLSDVLLFNRSDIAADRVSNGASLGGTRTLSGTIAHETVHLLVARRFGEVHSARLPAWKREGYADFVAGETSVDPRDEARIRAIDPAAGVLLYYDARRRVAAELRANGGSVGELLGD
ncbi:hypothetical protein ASG29_05815 [Sphingomonas sp. Leaf412]|uniref:hypothetical protein n=1 Tax=Sphingomonas sp. Leaf412 TaxID=1736370 RepID=UPI0006F880DB|nr:hypothetical protein [Sphingomonas sp. Leaf412]KQT33550.1 hypothetical protein ASG29_05815 [Sphingomonas sp. Leaf412]